MDGKEKSDDRNRQIVRLVEQGHSLPSIAARYNITKQRVYQIVRQQRNKGMREKNREQLAELERRSKG